MRHRRSRSATPADWPVALRHVIRAAELECPRGHADALLDLTSLALRKIPSRGIFDPAVRGEHDLFTAIESVARAHLDLTAAKAAWKTALDTANLNLDQRDEIERAALLVQSVSDTAYFYAGLGFGLAVACVYRSA
jgi:hypothetical protein